MAIYKTYRDDEFCWGIWKMDEPLEELLSLHPYGDVLLQKATERFTHDARRMEWIAVRVLLFHLLGSAPEIKYEASGKPYLSEIPISLSISHTRGYVAVACHKQQEVGIDIEQYSPRVLRLRERFMREDEYAQGDDIHSSLLFWSGKETLFKLLDQREVDFKKHLRIYPFSVQGTGKMDACEYKTNRKHHFTIKYIVDADFVFTFCTSTL